MKILIEKAAFGRWLGTLTVDGDVVYDIRGPRPGCVARDILNWVALNIMNPDTRVELEIITYE